MKNHAKYYVIACAAAVSLTLGGGMRLNAAEKLADTVYHNGTIYTVTEDFHKPSQLKDPNKAEVVATLNGKIVFVGTTAEATVKGYLDAANVAKIVDLRGKTMLPGFIDGHGHFPGQGELDLFQANLNSPPIGTMTSIKDYIPVLAALAAKTEEGKAVTGKGYDDTLVTEKRHPTKEDLDEASTKHPIVIVHTSDHINAGNSLAFQMAGFDRKDINAEGVYVRDGKPYIGVRTVKKADGWDFTGVCAETEAMGLLNDVTQNHGPSITDKSVRSVARASQVYVAAGVTTADLGGGVLAMPTVYGNAGFALNQIQTGLKSGVLAPRVVVHPFGYMAYGPVEMGKINRMVLGWTGDDYAEPGDTPAKGSDITSLSLKGVSAEMGGVAPEGLPPNRIFMGAWKIIYDGSNQGYTGYFKTPGYYDPGYGGYEKGYTGMPNATTFSKETLEKTIELYHAANQSIEVHTNGSWAAEDYVTALEKAVAKHPDIMDTRDCAIHGQMMERQHLERLVGDYSKLDSTKDMYTELAGAAVDIDLRAALHNGELMRKQNLVNSYFVNHAFYWGDRHMEIFMGPGRAKNMNPCGWSAAYDLPFSVHNDTTVTPISPLRSMEDAVTRISSPTPLGSGGTLISGEGKDLDAVAYYEETKGGEQKPFWNYDQRVNVLQALHAITIVPAYQNHMEDKIGSITEGKFADFTILDQDPFKIDPSGIAEMRVATTIVGDEPVHGVLPDSDTFASQLAPSYDQPNGTSVSSFEGTAIDNAAAEKNYASLPVDSKRLGTFAFTAELKSGQSAVFQMNVLGNGGAVSQVGLYKLNETKAIPYEYGKPSSDELATASGKWWIADIKAPTKALDPSDTLALDHTYMAFFVIADNDPVYDLDPADGVIKDPVSIATTGPLPTNGADATGSGNDGGSSSGCTVGSAPSYDLLVLLLGFSAVAAFRVLRRREER